VYATQPFVRAWHTDWLAKGEVQKLVIVINGANTCDVLERWVFTVETDKDSIAG
jgi:hypothetical protein